ncbi:MAG: zinc ribbon domain-containing protein [Polyangiaceae bacterium]
MRVRITKCHSCGGMKQLPSQTAYVYCDFCGALADWDFRTACSAGNALPGPAYEALAQSLAPQLRAAKLAGNAPHLKYYYTQLFTKHIELCPSSYSPRIVSPNYRTRYLDYYTDMMVVRDLDPRVAELAMLLNQRIAELRQAQFLGGGGMAVSFFGLVIASQPMSTQFPDREFWNVYQTFRAQYRMHMQAMLEAGVIAKYPDSATPELLERIGVSAFVQGWLTWISPAMQAHLIADAKLQDSYVDVSPPALLLRRCGRCGTRVDAVTGAWRVVCFTCGEQLDVKEAEVTCPGCGAPSSLVAGAPAHVCPYCGVRAEHVRGAFG